MADSLGIVPNIKNSAEIPIRFPYCFTYHLSVTEWIYITPLAILIVLMGICPEIFLSKIRPGVSHLAKNYQSYRLLIGDESQDDQVKPMMSARNPLGGER